MRMMTAAIVLVLLAGLALSVLPTRAQQPARAASPSQARKELRARIVALRTEVELLQIECDADKAVLTDLLKGARESESLEQLGDLGGPLRPGSTLVAGAAVDEEGEQPSLKVKVNKKAVEKLRSFLERKKMDYAKCFTELNEKKLDLADAERQYNETK